MTYFFEPVIRREGPVSLTGLQIEAMHCHRADWQRGITPFHQKMEIALNVASISSGATVLYSRLVVSDDVRERLAPVVQVEWFELSVKQAFYYPVVGDCAQNEPPWSSSDPFLTDSIRRLADQYACPVPQLRLWLVEAPWARERDSAEKVLIDCPSSGVSTTERWFDTELLQSSGISYGPGYFCTDRVWPLLESVRCSHLFAHCRVDL